MSAPALALALAVASAPASAPAPAPEVAVATSLGSFVLRLDPARAPRAVENFLAYVDAGFYDGTLFHRVIPGFMVQAGGFGPGLRERPGQRPPVPNESASAAPNRRGTVAAARTGAPDSARAQFYVNLVDNAALNARGPQAPGYTVFGEVIAGMEVLDRIAQVPVRCSSTKPAAACDGDLPPGMRDVPRDEVRIVSARRQASPAPPAPRRSPGQAASPTAPARR